MTPLLISTALLTASHVADWQLQCEQHGWKGLWWPAGARAPRWPWYADWFPHDAWHWAQLVRNWGALSACITSGMFWLWADWLYPIGFVTLYAITRGIGFSLPRKLAQGY